MVHAKRLAIPYINRSNADIGDPVAHILLRCWLILLYQLLIKLSSKLSVSTSLPMDERQTVQ